MKCKFKVFFWIEGKINATIDIISHQTPITLVEFNPDFIYLSYVSEHQDYQHKSDEYTDWDQRFQLKIEFHLQ